MPAKTRAMARLSDLDLVWRECLGRNTWEHPLEVPDNQGTEALNVVLREGQIGQKRPSSSPIAFVGDAFSGVNAAAEFLPDDDPTNAQLFLVSNDATTKIVKISNGNTAAVLTLKDNYEKTPWLTSFVALNKKLFIAYNSLVNRLHVYVPAESTTAVRRTGFAVPAARSEENTSEI